MIISVFSVPAPIAKNDRVIIDKIKFIKALSVDLF